MKGTFEEFLDALLAFESGWDRERYDAGIIQDWQLAEWAGGPVQDHFPNYQSWSELTDAEWEAMAYRSTNSYGFVGYQFGEALLIDLGYYDDDLYYGNGASSNTWDGSWTGKNGVNSLEDFMTKAAQDVAIKEAFGHNLGVIEDGLAAQGYSLDDFIGSTTSYTSGGTTIPVTISLTGILASAHLRGASSVVQLLSNGAVSNDEYGTSILQYMEQFGGFAAPGSGELISFYEDRLTGDEGLGVPGDPGSGGSNGNGTAGVDAETADVVIDWSAGTNVVKTGFDPASDTIYVGWFTADHIDVSESDGNVVFSVPSNNQSVTLQGISLSELSAANFTIMDSTAAQEILSLIGQDSDDGTDADTDGETGGDGGAGGDAGEATDGNSGGDSGENSGTDPNIGNGSANVDKGSADVVIDWAWGSNDVVTGFDPAKDTIFVGWFSAEHIDAYEENGSVVIAIPSNNQTTTLEGVSFSDLSAENFTISDVSARQEILALVGQSDASSETGDEATDQDEGGSGDVSAPPPNTGDGAQDVLRISWGWGEEEIISGFSPEEDVIDFGAIAAGGIEISEIEEDLHIEVLNNGGHKYILQNVQAEDLTLANLSAPDWNDVLTGPNGVVDQLSILGNEELA